MATNEEWITAMKAKGHSPILDEDGELDCWVMEFDIHNGPGCSICGDSWCEHCTKPEEIGACDCIEGAIARPAEMKKPRAG